MGSFFAWLSATIPQPLQWLLWFVGIITIPLGIWNFIMFCLRRIFGKPKLDLLVWTEENKLMCEILNIPIGNTMLCFLGIKRMIAEHLTADYIIQDDTHIIGGDDALFNYNNNTQKIISLLPSLYEGAKFEINTIIRRNSFFDKSANPLNPGGYTIIIEASRHSHITRWLKHFHISETQGKYYKGWADEDFIGRPI